MSKTDRVYNVYRWLGSRSRVVATIRGDRVTGEWADSVRAILLEGTGEVAGHRPGPHPVR